MLASPVERVTTADRIGIAPRPAPVDPGGPMLVAAFAQRAQALRAMMALRRLGCAGDQIRLEGPPGRPRRRRGSVALGGALLGAAAYRLAPTAVRGWLGGALAAPALGLSALAALTALANPQGLDVLPWRITIRSAGRLANAGGVLRAHGGRGVHVRPGAPAVRP
jgi:hypothetical protein